MKNYQREQIRTAMHLSLQAAATDRLVLLLHAKPFSTTQQIGGWGGAESLSSLSLPACRETDTRAQEMSVEHRRRWKVKQEAEWGWSPGQVCGSGSVPPLRDSLLATPLPDSTLPFTSCVSYQQSSFIRSSGSVSVPHRDRPVPAQSM